MNLSCDNGVECEPMVIPWLYCVTAAGLAARLTIVLCGIAAKVEGHTDVWWTPANN